MYYKILGQCFADNPPSILIVLSMKEAENSGLYKFMFTKGGHCSFVIDRFVYAWLTYCHKNRNLGIPERVEKPLCQPNSRRTIKMVADLPREQMNYEFRE